RSALLHLETSEPAARLPRHSAWRRRYIPRDLLQIVDEVVAFGVAVATVEWPAKLPTPLHQLAGATLRTCYACRQRQRHRSAILADPAGVLALGVAAAS